MIRNTFFLMFVFLLFAPASHAGPDFKNIFSDLAKKLKPAVANIYTKQKIRMNFQGRGRMNDDFFRRFMEHFGMPMMPAEREARSLGSGFVISEDGLVVTNNHVVQNADEIQIKFHGKQKKIKDLEFSAEILGTDVSTDLALLKIKSDRKFPYIDMGDSEKLEVGEWVMAIGNPYEHGHTVTVGIVSAKGRMLTGEARSPYLDYIQTDASINPGNSGGPLINTDGKVVGINTAIDARGQGLGFAIPVNTARHIITQLKSRGKVVRGWLGVGIDTLTPQLAKQLGLRNNKGVIIAEVFPGHPAKKAGIIPYDVIVSFDGEKVDHPRDLQQLVARTPVGKTINVVVIRKKKRKKVTVTIAALEAPTARMKQAPSRPAKETNFGMSTQKASPRLRNKCRLPSGYKGLVIVDVEYNSPAQKAGLQQCDMILEINQVSVTTPSKLNKLLSRGNSHLLRLKRGENTFIIIIEK